MIKKRGLEKENFRQRISNNILAVILLVVIAIGLLTIGVALTSSNVESAPRQTISDSSYDIATGIVTLEVMPNPDKEDPVGRNK